MVNPRPLQLPAKPLRPAKRNRAKPAQPPFNVGYSINIARLWVDGMEKAKVEMVYEREKCGAEAFFLLFMTIKGEKSVQRKPIGVAYTRSNAISYAVAVLNSLGESKTRKIRLKQGPSNG